MIPHFFALALRIVRSVGAHTHHRISLLLRSARSAATMASHDVATQLISTAEPCTRVLGFHHLGVAVSSRPTSVEFYSKIGFSLLQETATNTIMVNRGGMEIHLFQCDRPLEDGNNILMDFPTQKYPGHTHASFTVPNVPLAQAYIESQGIKISGERKGADRLFAVFARDPDRTTLEFELNSGEPKDVVFTGDMIGYPQCMDHIGIRVTNPEDRMLFYAEKFGFVKKISTYDPSPDVLKNGRPWITRTLSGCDINFIINGNVTASENILLADGSVRPGIVFLALTVADVTAAAAQLHAAGVAVVPEAELATSPLRALAGKIVPSADGKSVFVQDADLNILRLVTATASPQ